MAKRRYSKVVALDGYRVEKTRNGHLQMIVPLKVVDCADESRVGEEFTHFQIVTLNNEKSPGFAVSALRALGMSNSNILDPQGLGSVVADCTEEYETYEGKSSWKSKYINPVKDRPGISEDELGEFAALLSGAFDQAPPVEVTEANKAPEKLPEAPPAASDDPGIDDDDWA
jgi:hypothetical protein